MGNKFAEDFPILAAATEDLGDDSYAQEGRFGSSDGKSSRRKFSRSLRPRCDHHVGEGRGLLVLTGYESVVIVSRSGHSLSMPVATEQVLAYARLQNEEIALGGKAGETRIPSLAMVEWEYMQRILSVCGGNVSQAARVLGLHRRSLQRKLSRYPPRR